MRVYLRPSPKLTRSHARNIVWRIINKGLLPVEHQSSDVYVGVSVRDLPEIMNRIYSHSKWERVGRSK